MTKKTDLNKLSEQELLDLRMCDLPVRLKGSWVETCVKQLYQELEDAGLPFKPRVYVGDEWFSPDQVAAIAVPFYLFHPRLLQLEKKMMAELEGSDHQDCMRFLRHECGHALCHAYHLPKRRRWVSIFGSAEKEFDNFFHYWPYSRSFVHHLKGWYAQSHPEEDFAETFAVWLTPGLNWEKRYQRWPAIKKLRYLDQLMLGLRNKAPKPDHGEMTFRLSSLRRRLSKHYAERRKLYDEEEEDYFDEDLARIFSKEGHEKNALAAEFLRENRRMLENAVSRWARERKFTVQRLLKTLTRRCRTMKLHLPNDTERAKTEFTAYLSALVSNYIHTARFKRRV